MPPPVTAWITAVHVDARERQIQRPAAPKILLARATDALLALTVRDSDNERTDLTGATLTLTVASDAALASVLFSLAADLVGYGDEGEAEFEVSRMDTADLALGKLWYCVDAVWADGTREQLVRVTEMRLLASGALGSPLGGTLRALRVGSVTFAGETELTATFVAALTIADYIPRLTPGVDAETGGVPFAGATDQTTDGFLIRLSGPFTGLVHYAVYDPA